MFKMKKVVLIANMEEVIYLFRRQLVSALVAAGYQVTMVAPEGTCGKEMASLGADRIEFPISRHGCNPFSELRLFFRYFFLLRRLKPDMVFTYTVKPNSYAGIACRLLGIPFVPNVTGVGEAFQKKGAVQYLAVRLLRTAFKGAGTVFFQNRANAEQFMAEGIVTDKQVALLPGSGVDLDENCYREYPPEREILRFGMAARFCCSKGVKEYFQAAEYFAVNHPGRAEFVYTGIVDDKELLKKLDKGFVKILPQTPVKEMPYFFAGLDAFVLPSYHEGLSNVLLESLAAGRPVLASDIPGCRECCGNDSGIVFAPGSTDALIKALEQFMALDYTDRAAMGRRGREFVEKSFSRRIVTDRYLQLLKD